LLNNKYFLISLGELLRRKTEILSAIVEFGAKAAWEDYEAVNQF
jgi:hypothetical protein